MAASAIPAAGDGTNHPASAARGTAEAGWPPKEYPIRGRYGPFLDS